MALSCRALSRNCNFIVSLTKPVKCYHPINLARIYPVRVLSSGISFKNTHCIRPNNEVKRIDFLSVRQWTTQGPKGSDQPVQESVERKGLKGLFLKFKEMYRDYWYVLVPVHMATSAIWFGSFYYAVCR